MNTSKILVVDDEPICVKILVDQLHDLNYQTDYAYGGEDAWHLLQQHPQDYALVIADRMMIGMDGLMLLRKIKTNKSLSHIPFLMLTGEADVEDRIVALQAGAVDCLFKPVDSILLLHLIKRYVA